MIRLYALNWRGACSSSVAGLRLVLVALVAHAPRQPVFDPARAAPAIRSRSRAPRGLSSRNEDAAQRDRFWTPRVSSVCISERGGTAVLYWAIECADRRQRMNRRRVGLVLLNMAGVLVIAGSLYDLLVPSVPANHLTYLGAGREGLDPRYAELDLAMLRSIGGCLLAVGVTTTILANGPARRGEIWSLLTAALLVGVAEGNNAYRMYRFGSPWYGPLAFAVLAVGGAALAMPQRRATVAQTVAGPGASPPNGGQAAPSDDTGAPDGPPSVS